MPHEEEKAPPAKEKHVDKKGKKIRKGRKHCKIDVKKFYEIKGSEVVRKRSPCPRCGPGTYMANHKGRQYCGRCGYTIFETKK